MIDPRILAQALQQRQAMAPPQASPVAPAPMPGTSTPPGMGAPAMPASVVAPKPTVAVMIPTRKHKKS